MLKRLDRHLKAIHGQCGVKQLKSNCHKWPSTCPRDVQSVVLTNDDIMLIEEAPTQVCKAIKDARQLQVQDFPNYEAQFQNLVRGLVPRFAFDYFYDNLGQRRENKTSRFKRVLSLMELLCEII